MALAAWDEHLDKVLGLREKLQVRTLRPGEQLPDNLPHNMPLDFQSPQPDWIWIVTSYDRPVAMLIAAPAQTIVYMLRICAAADGANDGAAALMLLLRTAIREMRTRGYLGYMVNLDPKHKMEAFLLRLISSTGKDKAQIVSGMVLAAGPTDVGDW